MVSDPAVIAAIVREHRRRLGLSQHDLAARAGVSVATISRIERLDRTGKDPDGLQARVLHRVAFALGRRDGTPFLEAADIDPDYFQFVDDAGGVMSEEMWRDVVAELNADDLQRLREYAEFLRSKHDG